MPPVMSGNLGTVSGGGFTTSTIVLPPSNIVMDPNAMVLNDNDDSFDGDDRKK
jgi:hypothetical protein